MAFYSFPCPECCCTDCTGTDVPDDSLAPCCDWWGFSSFILSVEDLIIGDTVLGDVCFTLVGNGCGKFQFGPSTTAIRKGLPVTIPETTIVYECKLTVSEATKTWHATFTVGGETTEFAQTYLCGLCANPNEFNPDVFYAVDAIGPENFYGGFGTGDNFFRPGFSTLGAGSCCDCDNEGDCELAGEEWDGPPCCPYQTLKVTVYSQDEIAGTYFLDSAGPVGGVEWAWLGRECCYGFGGLYLLSGNCGDSDPLPRWRLDTPAGPYDLYSPGCCGLFAGDACGGHTWSIECAECEESYLGGPYCIANVDASVYCANIATRPEPPAFAVSGPYGQNSDGSTDPGCTGCDGPPSPCVECCEGSRGFPTLAYWEGATFGAAGDMADPDSCVWTWTDPAATLTLSAGRVATLVVDGVGTYSATLDDCCTQYTAPYLLSDFGGANYYPLALTTPVGEDPPALQGISILCCLTPGPVPEIIGYDCNPGTGNCIGVAAPETPDYETKAECEEECLKHGFACLPLTGCTEGDYDADEITVYDDVFTCRSSPCTVEGWRCVTAGTENPAEMTCMYDAAWVDDGSPTYETEGACQSNCSYPGYVCDDGVCEYGTWPITNTIHPSAGACALACCFETYQIVISGSSCPDTNGTWYVVADPVFLKWVGTAGSGTQLEIRPAATTSCTESSPPALYEVYWSDGSNFASWCLDSWNCSECAEGRLGSSSGCVPTEATVDVCPVIPFRLQSADQEQKPVVKTSPKVPARRQITKPKKPCGCKKKKK